MSKVICDVCGTTYPETAAQCPICGSAKNSTNRTAAGAPANEDASSASYAYVKGGRFSKKNVRRRSKGAAVTTTAQRRSERSDRNSRSVREKEEPNNTGLVIVVVLLMIAIVLVLVYIGMNFPNSNDDGGATGNTGGNTVQTGDPTVSSGVTEVPCTGLKLSNSIIEFAAAGESWQLQVELTPVDTTEQVTFTSTDPSIATVAEDGTVTAVGGGGTVIVVTCGDQTANCVISCNFGEQGGDDPTVGTFEFEFNTPFTDSTTGFGDTTLSAQGATWKAYKTSLDIDPALITWITDDPNVCTIEKGIVTAVGPGTTKIHAQYNGITYSCVVRCSFSLSDVTGECKLSHTDVTIAVGESFTLKLKDSSGNAVSTTFTCEGEGVTISGNKITGAVSGVWKVSTTYDGVTYTCTVRVK